MRRELLMAGSGWIASGIICISVWLLERGFENAEGLLFTGLVVIVVGAWILLLNKRLERLIAKFEAEAAKRKTAQS
ncbi:MAG: hypothetical protein KGH94_04000 [Candidatus Micrarchaeota archaeon]|nr:hypothetical protein [Candidatus Micrarchaeota archaeon]